VSGFPQSNVVDLKSHKDGNLNLLASIVEFSDDAILGISPEGNITSWNNGAQKIFGYTELEAVGKSVWLIYPQHNKLELQEILSRLNKGEVLDHFETQRQAKDGTILEVSLSISPIKDSEGKVIGISKIIRDLSRQKTATGYARSLIEASLDPLVTISAEGKITDVNHSTEDITGVAREWLIGTDFSNYFTEPRKARQGYSKVP
jgi:PAS domain S-box-containing protein